MIDRWQEIFETIRKNKLRTMLTGLSVAWGIFMLVILLGAGTGLQNQVEYQFRDDAVNSIWVYRGQTTKAHKGYPVGRNIQFENDDHNMIRDDLDGVEYITSRFYLRGNFTISWKGKHGGFEVRSCHPDHKYLENTLMVKGRFLNDLDLREKRKVAVIGSKVVETLFEKSEPMGEWINVSGIPYRVVGVFEDSGGENEMRKVYIPITTAQLAYGGGEKVHQIMFTVGDASVEETMAMEDELNRMLAARHRYATDDTQAVRFRNNVENFKNVRQIFFFIKMFIWIIGIGTIVAGIVGISNIMLISVKERTKEIGIRKALGATPFAVVRMILEEAVIITAVAGYGGMILGIGLLELVTMYMPENDFIRNPQVNLAIVAGATALLVFCGAVAGFIPARRAAAVKPMVALRDE